MDIKKALVVGGSNGIGLGIVAGLLEQGCTKVFVADKAEPEIRSEKVSYINLDLTDFSENDLPEGGDLDAVIITAGFGRSAEFSTITPKEIENSFAVNSVGVLKIIRYYYHKLCSAEPFYCAVMGSIAGLVSSPLFALYAATKAAVCRFIESVNVELEQQGSENRILNVSPGSIKGTKFNGGSNDLAAVRVLAQEILARMCNREQLFIPDYEEVYKGVLNRYHADPHTFGVQSYQYKKESNRMNPKPQIKVGYLSGTFDLFHIGHLNLLKRAKKYCDFLVVGVHKDASHKGKTAYIPFEERVEILKSIKHVDMVIPSLPEDMDVYQHIPYDYLFVGSDYKGTERFKRYEAYFADKNVEIVYFPYTKGTSSTQIRKTIEQTSTTGADDEVK